MGDTRDVYFQPEDRAVLRTADVYQTNLDNGTVGYSDKLLSVVANFKNSGIPEGANAQSMVGKSKRGEVALRLFAVVDDEAQAFTRVGFKVRGCLAMTACASVVCDLLAGRSFDQALEITQEQVSDAVGGVPQGKGNTLVFAVEGIRALVGDYLVRNGATLQQLQQRALCDQDGINCIMCEHCSMRDTLVDLRVCEALAAAEAAR